MSNVGVTTPAISTTAHVPVIQRKMLYTGPIVKMKIPVGATERSYLDDTGARVSYLQFAHNVPGGRVNFFVHTPGAELRGCTITAMASLLMKELVDGREFYYIDLNPVADDTPITHRLAIMSWSEGLWDKDGFTVFKTPAPLRGAIIFAPSEAKVSATAAPIPVQQKKLHVIPKASKPTSTTGDSQLDRYLAAGWTVTGEDEWRVHLTKKSGGKERKIVHARPRNRQS